MIGYFLPGVVLINKKIQIIEQANNPVIINQSKNRNHPSMHDEVYTSVLLSDTSHLFE